MKKQLHQLTSGKTGRFVVQSCVVNEDPINIVPSDTPEKLYDFWKNIIAEQPDYDNNKEMLVVVLLNTKFRPYAWNTVSLGTVNETSGHPREIFRPVIVGGAYAFVLMHNHPSGDPSPSKADEAITRRIAEVSKLLQIRMLDHIVVGESSRSRQPYFSFREAGIIG